MTTKNLLSTHFICGTALPVQSKKGNEISLELNQKFPTKKYEAGEVKINHFEKVGNYAIRIYFSDGHKTGIYSWNTLIKIDQAKPNPGGLN